MNLEPKVESKALWWDGEYGGVVKDNKFLMLYRKPTLPLPPFDAMLAKPNAGVGDGNFFIYNNVKTLLTADQIHTMDAVIDSAFPTQGGGGGGTDPNAVTKIMADGIKPNLLVQKADGSLQTVGFGPNIQNTPAYNLAIQLKSNPTSWNHDVDPNAGVPYEGPDKLHILPKEMWTMGGQQRGARYNPDDGTFELLANSLEVQVMVRLIASMDKNCEHFSKGMPHGELGMTVVLQRKEGGNWETVAENTLIAMSNPTTAPYPNSQQPCVGLYNRGFKANLAKGGIYRIGVRGHLGDDSSLWPHWRMFYSTWDASSDPAYWHFQITGAIKDVGGIDDIPPYRPT